MLSQRQGSEIIGKNFHNDIIAINKKIIRCQTN